MNTTVNNHLEARRLEVRPAADDEVAAYWEKALVAYADASNAGSSRENRLLRAYTPAGSRRSRSSAPRVTVDAVARGITT
ncbi:MAG TPA: hypothetical protein VFQ39_14115 [Longimicrobium sp.]|nr:hypothetical protein [Longimicrobium sp.]